MAMSRKELGDRILHAVAQNTVQAYQAVGVSKMKKAIRENAFPTDTPRGFSRWTFDRFVTHLQDAKRNMGLSAMRARVRMALKANAPSPRKRSSTSSATTRAAARAASRAAARKPSKPARRTPSKAAARKPSKPPARRTPSRTSTSKILKRFTADVDSEALRQLETAHFYVRRAAWNGLLDVRPRCMPKQHTSVEGHSVTCHDTSKSIQLQEMQSGFVKSFQNRTVNNPDAAERNKRGEFQDTMYDQFIAGRGPGGMPAAAHTLARVVDRMPQGAHVYFAGFTMSFTRGDARGGFPGHPTVHTFPQLVDHVKARKPEIRFILVVTNLPGHYNLVVVDVAQAMVQRFEPGQPYPEQDAKITAMMKRMCQGMTYNPRILGNHVGPQAVANGPFCGSWMLMMAFLFAVNASELNLRLDDVRKYFVHKSLVSRAKGRKAFEENRRYLYRKVGLFTAYLWELSRTR